MKFGAHEVKKVPIIKRKHLRIIHYTYVRFTIFLSGYFTMCTLFYIARTKIWSIPPLCIVNMADFAWYDGVFQNWKGE